MSIAIPHNRIRLGGRYLVEIEAIGAAGSFISTISHMQRTAGEIVLVQFQNGVTLTNVNGCIFRETLTVP